jgi:hypothetical protein
MKICKMCECSKNEKFAKCENIQNEKREIRGVSFCLSRVVLNNNEMKFGGLSGDLESYPRRMCSTGLRRVATY